MRQSGDSDHDSFPFAKARVRDERSSVLNRGARVVRCAVSGMAPLLEASSRFLKPSGPQSPFRDGEGLSHGQSTDLARRGAAERARRAGTGLRAGRSTRRCALLLRRCGFLGPLRTVPALTAGAVGSAPCQQPRAHVYRGWSLGPAPALHWRGIGNCHRNPDEISPRPQGRGDCSARWARPLVEPNRKSGVPQGGWRHFLAPTRRARQPRPRALSSHFEGYGLPWGRAPLLVSTAKGGDPVASQDWSGEEFFHWLASLALGDSRA